MKAIACALGAFLLLTLPAACIMEDDGPPVGDEEIGETTSEISSGLLVSYGSALARSTVILTLTNGANYCTGVIVGARNVITASHCRPRVGHLVKFYTGPYPTYGVQRTITSVDYPSGVDPSRADYIDSRGKFADIAHVGLNAGIPDGSRIASLALTYPGNDAWGFIVGAGVHWGDSNDSKSLRRDSARTYSSHINDGHFLTNEHATNKGDSGGPFYRWNNDGDGWQLEVHGVLFGGTYEWAWRGKYTSTRHHLGWLSRHLRVLQWDTIYWKYGDQRHFGTVLKTMYLPDEEREVCAIACKQRSACVGVNYYRRSGNDMCQLMSNITFTGAFRNYWAGTRVNLR